MSTADQIRIAILTGITMLAMADFAMQEQTYGGKL